MYKAATGGYINATDLADYMVKKGLPFRTAYKIVGGIVAECISRGVALDELPLESYKAHSDIFAEDLYGEISLESCVAKRISKGSTGYASVNEQIAYVEAFLNK